MGFYFFGLALIAVTLLAQGFYIAKKGTLGWFFVRPVRGINPLPALRRLPARMAAAALYVAPGLAILALIAQMMARRHVTLALVGEHLRNDYAALACAAGMEAGGIWCVIHPSGMINQIVRGHPEFSESDPSASRIVRVLGVGLCSLGLVLLFAFLFTPVGATA